MLPFGSLLSQVPLLVLAFAYLIYFGASAVNKTVTGNEQELSINNKVQVVKKTAVSTREKNVYYYQSLEGKVNISKETLHNIYYQHLILLPRYIPDKKVTSYHEGCNLFSRPPPSPLG